MAVYTPSAVPAGTWPEPIESIWSLVSRDTTRLPGYPRPDLSLADRLFIGAVVNLPAERRPWGCLTWLAQAMLYAIGERAWTSLVARPSGHARGLMFGVLAATGQAWGLVLSKQGMTGGFSPFAGNAIRMLAAAAAFWLITLAQGQGGETVRVVKAQPGALKLLALGALVGPVLGVSASLLAVQHAEIGVASTLMALPPVFLLPISYWVFKERFGWQTVAGTVVAMLGVGVLFLV